MVMRAGEILRTRPFHSKLARTAVTFLFCGALLFSCSNGANEQEARLPLLSGLGDYTMPITTRSQEAQQYFDQGLILVYAFNHAEAVRSFQEAARLDPTAPMPYWGIALALGPNLNHLMDRKAEVDAYLALRQAKRHSVNANALEKAFIDAMARRFSAQPVDDRYSFDVDYARAMRRLAGSYPQVPETAVLYAEALMVLSPWDYWTRGGQPKNQTETILSVLEDVLSKWPTHPGAHHYYIHALEASPFPEKALKSADLLETAVPGAGHLVHMPSHIYLRLGQWARASDINDKAVASDESYFQQIANCQPSGIYPSLYYPHNMHFLWASASMEGRASKTIEASRRLLEEIPAPWIERYPSFEEFEAIPYFALTRFGRWEEILSSGQPSRAHEYTSGIWHFARGLASGALQDKSSAAMALDSLTSIIALPSVSEERLYLGSTKAQLLTIAQQVLSARVAELDGREQASRTALRRAIALQDSLRYSEPPAWYMPVRQNLGALLLRQNKSREAAEVFREDLKQHPNNGWSLYGLSTALRNLGESTETDSVAAAFRKAWERADVENPLQLL